MIKLIRHCTIEIRKSLQRENNPLLQALSFQFIMVFVLFGVNGVQM